MLRSSVVRISIVRTVPCNSSLVYGILPFWEVEASNWKPEELNLFFWTADQVEAIATLSFQKDDSKR